MNQGKDEMARDRHDLETHKRTCPTARKRSPIQELSTVPVPCLSYNENASLNSGRHEIHPDEKCTTYRPAVLLSATTYIYYKYAWMNREEEFTMFNRSF